MLVFEKRHLKLKHDKIPDFDKDWSDRNNWQHSWTPCSDRSARNGDQNKTYAKLNQSLFLSDWPKKLGYNEKIIITKRSSFLISQLCMIY